MLKLLKSGMIVACAMLLTVVSALLHGRDTHRWAVLPSQECEKHLTSLPTQFGDWQVREVTANVDWKTDQVQSWGCLERVYVDSRSGCAVTVSMIVGPREKVWTHRPDPICVASEYSLPQPAEEVVVSDSGDVFRRLTMEPTGLDGESLRVYYAWGRGDRWLAPDVPRWTFGGEPFLCGMIVTGTVSRFSSNDTDICESFLQDFLAARSVQDSLRALANEAGREPNWNAVPLLQFMLQQSTAASLTARAVRASLTWAE